MFPQSRNDKDFMLAVIPARGGSKGVPHKNIKLLNGKPLIGYTVEAAVKAKIFSKIIVSTDDEEIAKIAVEYGADVPFVRPAEISGDFVSSDEVLLHAIEYFQKDNMQFNFICKLQPTSPLRTARHIREAFSVFTEKEADFIVSVCECEHTPLWSKKLGKNGEMDNFVHNEIKLSCRQKLDTYYRLNGAIYMANMESFIKEKCFFGKKSFAYIMSQEDSIDIDSRLDFLIAETILKSRSMNSNLL